MEMPSATEIIEIFGTWNRALEAAGLGPVDGDIAVAGRDEGVPMLMPHSDEGKEWLDARSGQEGVTPDRGVLFVQPSLVDDLLREARGAGLAVAGDDLAWWVK